MIRKNINLNKTHQFFYVNVRPWPLLCSIVSFNFLFRLGLMLKYGIILNLAQNLIRITISSFVWWINYRIEYNNEGINSKNLESGLKFSMLLFISSEIFFFFSFFWSYFHFYLSPTIETGLLWPPYLLIRFNWEIVPLINTLILIASGVTVTLRHLYIIKSKTNRIIIFLTTTIILGIIFTLLQIIEYFRSFFSMSDSVFGTSFFILTGFHGIHVIIGTIFLITVLFRSLSINLNKEELHSFELASWYWHFVDVVWLFLYFILYYVNN